MKKLWLFLKSHWNGRVNIKDFGAKSDSVTDDTAAFQEAVNYAQKYGLGIYIPSGATMISNCTFTGEQKLAGEPHNKS